MDKQRATLRDVLNYQPELYLSKEEQDLIRNVFKYNPNFLKILRKVFLPSLTDPELPNEELESDIFLQGRIWSQIPADEAKILIVARQETAQFIMNGLVKLRVIASTEEETEEEKTTRLKKDSTK